MKTTTNKKPIKEKVLREMAKSFVHWAEYNPTLVRKEYGCSVDELKGIVMDIIYDVKC